MGKNKKVTKGESESSKASTKSDNILREKNDLSRLISKVMRPKVYITDSSRFKSLVQELTGNGSTVSATSESTIRVDEAFDDGCCLESSFESSVEAEREYSCEFLNGFCLDQEFDQTQVCDIEYGLEDMNSGTDINQLEVNDLFAHCWDVESLLLDDTNPYTFCDGFDQFLDVTVYDGNDPFGLL